MLIACGALAREITNIIDQHQLDFIKIECLPAEWHNHPSLIVPEIRKKIASAKSNENIDKVFVAYGDCGTGGALDKLLSEEGVERLAGNHCYDFYSGLNNFEKLSKKEIGSFYLTDYLVRFFDQLIIKGLGIKKHPELQDIYFKHYKKLIYLAQTKDQNLQKKARAAAKSLNLEYSYVYTGYGGLETFLKKI